MLARFIADRSLFAWLTLCLGATICALIVLDLPNELRAWDYLSNSGFSAWVILVACSSLGCLIERFGLG